MEMPHDCYNNTSTGVLSVDRSEKTSSPHASKAKLPCLGLDRKKPCFAWKKLVVVPRPALAAAMRHPLLQNLLPTDAGYYRKAEDHVCNRETGCPETIFIYSTEGNGWCELAGQRHEVSKNQLLAINANIPHAYGADKDRPWTIQWFHALGSNLPHYLEQLGVSNQAPVVSLGGDVQLFSLFDDLREGLRRGHTMTHLIYAAHSLAHLMGLLMRHKEDFLPEGETSTNRIGKSVEFMREHLREALDVDTLAAVVNLSPSYYTALFRRLMGHGPVSHLNYLRMERALQLLTTTDWPVKRISSHLGFSDPLYFSRAFKRTHRSSPTEHRQSHPSYWGSYNAVTRR